MNKVKATAEQMIKDMHIDDLMAATEDFDLSEVDALIADVHIDDLMALTEESSMLTFAEMQEYQGLVRKGIEDELTDAECDRLDHLEYKMAGEPVESSEW